MWKPKSDTAASTACDRGGSGAKKGDEAGGADVAAAAAAAAATAAAAAAAASMLDCGGRGLDGRRLAVACWESRWWLLL